MATGQDFIDYVAEQAGLGERLTRKKMFGEYALYVDGKVVAFACDNSLFVKPSAAALRTLLLDTATLMPEPKPKKPPARKARTPRTR